MGSEMCIRDSNKIADAAMAKAKEDGIDVVIFDTAGRLQIDEPLVQELVRLRDRVEPREILLVLDAATGQEAVSVATHFDEALGIPGAILTKLDGDARGGAASSTSRISRGSTRSRRRTSSCTSGSSICSRPAVSKMTTSMPSSLALALSLIHI